MLDSGFTLKKLPTGFANGIDVGSEIPRGGKDDFKAFDLSSWKDGITLSRYGGDGERCMLGEENQGFESGYVNLHMPSR